MPLLFRPPAISIVTATYNRSRALACAIESARRQSFEDWELIVVGDACTDDTMDVVRRIGDPRIRAINLHRNFGEQAGPNNIGVAEARAPLIAFLNHDDLWFPHHLALCRELLVGESADLVFGAVANLQPDTPLPLDVQRLNLIIEGLFAGGELDPAEMDAGVVPASAWLVRKDALARAGGWRLARHCHVEPSQDLLFRLWRAGARLRALNVPTVIAVNSGTRPRSYISAGATEQEWLLGRLSQPGFAAEATRRGVAAGRTHLRPAAWKRALAGGLARVGVNPREIKFRFRRRLGKGEWIDQLRRVRGLPARPADAPADWWLELVRLSARVAPGSSIDFRAGQSGAGCLLAGWGQPEAHGVWSNGAHASMLLAFTEPVAHDVDLAFTVHAFGGKDRATRRAEVSIENESLALWDVESAAGATLRHLTLPARATRTPVALQFHFANPESPKALGLSEDPRYLSMSIAELRIK